MNAKLENKEIEINPTKLLYLNNSLKEQHLRAVQGIQPTSPENQESAEEKEILDSLIKEKVSDLKKLIRPGIAIP